MRFIPVPMCYLFMERLLEQAGEAPAVHFWCSLILEEA